MHSPLTLHGVLNAWCIEDAAAPVLRGMQGPWLSRADLMQRIEAGRAVLRQAGLRPCDRVATLMPQGLDGVIAALQVACACSLAPLRAGTPAQRWPELLAALDPAAVVVSSEAEPGLAAAATARRIRLLHPKDLLAAPPPSAASRSGPDPDGDLLEQVIVIATSGTTGQPKWVRHRHDSLLRGCRATARSLALTAADRALLALPLHHVHGLVSALLLPLSSGGGVVVAEGFDASALLACVGDQGITWISLPPAMHRQLLDQQRHTPLMPGHRLRFLRSGAVSLPLRLIEELQAAFAVPLIEAYGMSECPHISGNPIAAPRPGSVGKPVVEQLAIVDGAGKPLPAGEWGQVVVRGAPVMDGYRHGDSSGAAGSLEDWLQTGDEGRLDADGYLHLRGRLVDRINRGGQNVMPAVVEAALLSHPEVGEAMAFGLPHPTLGEDLAAVVVLRAGAAADESMLRSHVLQRLAPHERPSRIVLMERLPHGAGGKPDRQALSALQIPGMVAARVAPSSDLERRLHDLWREVLGHDAFGVSDHFFSIGGDSLRASRLVGRLERMLGETVYVSSVFEAPTIASYAAYLQREYQRASSAAASVSERPCDQPAPGVNEEMLDRLRQQLCRPHPTPGPVESRNPTAIFILSAPRSGSTLLRVMLGGNPRLFAPPELFLLPFDNLMQRRDWFCGATRFRLEGVLRALLELRGEPLEQVRQWMAVRENAGCSIQDFYREIQVRLGDRILVDKTPYNAINQDTLRRAEDYFLDPFYIHLVRHPCGVIHSFGQARLEQVWMPLLALGGMSGRSEFSPSQLAELTWIVLNENITGFLRGVPAHRQMRIGFEDLVVHPERVMRSFCERAGLAYSPAMIRPYEASEARMTDGLNPLSRMNGDPKFHHHRKIDGFVADRWKTVMHGDVLSIQARHLARALGYEIELPWLKIRRDAAIARAETVEIEFPGNLSDP